MSEVVPAVITCGGCNKRFAWKPELAGKRVKCKCGQAIAVPAAPGGAARVIPQSPKAQAVQGTVLKAGAAVVQKPITKPKPVVQKAAPPPKPAQEDNGLADLYALADDADRASAAMPVEVAEYVAPPVAAPANKSGRASAASGIPLGYAGPPGARARAKQAEAAASLSEPARDLYAPLAILAIGLIVYMSYFVVAYHLPSGAVPVIGFGVVVLTAFQAALLVGFAFVVAGPLGVSFGSPLPAVLKLAAMAVAVDGAVAWVDVLLDKTAGGFGSSGFFGFGLIGFPVAAGIFWTLLVQLFSMDAGDSWRVVVCFSIFSRVVKFVLFMLLLNMILGWGGVAVPAAATTAKVAKSAHSSLLSTHIDDLKDRDMLIEARKYIAAGHQSVVLKSANDWYAVGCPNVWFEMTSRDINGHRTEMGLVVELPEDKTKRAKCFTILGGYLKDIGWKQVTAADTADTGEDYLELDLH